jgi:prevent-host-death family protein
MAREIIGLVWSDYPVRYAEHMVVRNIAQAKAELSALLEAVQRGEDVIIAKAGKPIARLVPYQGARRRRTPGEFDGQIWIAPDFDELPNDMAEALGMKDATS